MTPLGHVAVSIVAGHSLKRISLPALVIGGLLPDIDFLMIFSDYFNQVHRVITHNLFFIVLACLIAMAASSDKKGAMGISMLIGGVMHLFIDACMDNNPSNGIGVALFWPLSETFFSPFNLLPLSAGSHGWSQPVQMLKTIIPNMLYEVPFYFLASFQIRRHRILSRAA